ncbi:MAG: lipid-A-disaccharide synthase [Campylobacteraceae bacterium]|jgi:lipid-A-disaccharide synthase|nr:lipid-A-disaccharide synthase [Campylobacteraceae bacterium]
MRKILVSALEPSANLHLKPVLEHLKEYELSGIFDKEFGSPLYASSEFSVMGFLDIFAKIAKAQKAIKQMALMSLEAEHVLLIDSPAFNLPLAKAIRKINKSVPITWYILPKVWAWKKKRAKKVQKYCTNLASIFPFEDRFYKRCVYVGNPLLDEIKKSKTQLVKSGKIVFMPGSRKSEVRALIDIFKQVAKKLDKENIIVIPKHFSCDEVSELYGDLTGFTISHDTHESLYEAEFAFVCSGTATLEAALIGTPFVLCYKAKKLDYYIARMLVKLKYAGLANIIFDFCGQAPLHKELLQYDVSVSNLLSEYNDMDRETYLQRAQKLKGILMHGSSQEVAKIIEV